MLGVPAVDWEQFAQWAAELADGGGCDALEYYVDLMVADRCYRMGDDVLSRLISTGVAGEDLTIDEIQLAVRAMLTLAHRAENATKRT